MILRYANLQRVTRSLTLPFISNQEKVITEVALSLVDKTEALSQPIRLLGVSISNLSKVVHLV